MSDEVAMSIETVRKALLEKEREKLLSESESAELSDDEKRLYSNAGGIVFSKTGKGGSINTF